MKSKRAKACDIPKSVKDRVWERDGGRCVVCGDHRYAMPNAHYISRAKGGLGIEQNIVTLCSSLSPNKCHYRYDSGTAQEREAIGAIIRDHFKSHYPDWDEEKLFYRKRGGVL